MVKINIYELSEAIFRRLKEADLIFIKPFDVNDPEKPIMVKYSNISKDMLKELVYKNIELTIHDYLMGIVDFE